MNSNKQRGVGLIEALIAFLVVGIGIAALVKLEGTFLQSSSESKARTVALGLAQEKLDDLKGFVQIDADANKFDYMDIGANTGGALSGGNLLFPSGAVSATRLPNTNVGYNVSWSVNNGYWTPVSGVLTLQYPTSGTPPKPIPDQKRVTVTVSWVDQKNTTQSVQLQGIIAALAPQNTDALADESGAGPAGKPKVIYSPSTDPGVVAVSVGTSVSRETLVPTSDSANQVKFTAYTYKAGGELLRQEDFLTVSCQCEFTTSGEARTPGYAKWDSTIDTYKDYDGDVITKTRGQRSTGGKDEMCDICCRDHHDAGDSAVDGKGVKYCDPVNGIRERCFDPFRDSSDFSSGKHNHYTSNGTLASSEYLESCRMKRINGYWRVYQDWHRVDLSAFPVSEITAVDTEATYAGYVQDVVDALLEDDTITSFNGQAFTKPSKPSGVNRTSSNPVNLAINQTIQLTGRAVYIDFFSSDMLSHIRNKKDNTEDYLVDVPFYEVEVTNRIPRCASATTAYGGWCPPGSNALSVGAGDIGDKKGNGLLAGQVEGLAGTGGGTTDVAFSMRRSNSGLMGLTSPVDVHVSADNRDMLRDTANVTFTVTGAGSTTHLLTVSLAGGTPTSGTLLATPTSGAGSCSGSGTSYSCTVPNNTSGSLTFTGSTATETCSGTGSYPSSSANQSVTLNITCSATSSTHTLTVTLSGGTPTTGTLTATPASDSASCTGSGTSYSCSVPNSVAGSLSFTGITSAGGECSGTGSYPADSANQSVAMTISCVEMRTATSCVTSVAGTDVQSGTLTPSTTGNCNYLTTCGQGNKGRKFSCTLPNGVTGTLTFSGTRKSGGSSVACSGSKTFSSEDVIDFTCN